MSKVELALKLHRVALEFLEEAHKEEQEQADQPFDPSLKKLLEEARAELDKTAGALVTMRNQWLAEVKRRETAEATVTSQRETLRRQSDELFGLNNKLTAKEQEADDLLAAARVADERVEILRTDIRTANRKADEARSELARERLSLTSRVNELEETAAGLRRENSELRAEADRVTRLAEAGGIVTTG